MTEMIVNFDEPRERANLVRTLSAMRGMRRVEVKMHRKKRTNPQNAFYWGVVLAAFVNFRHEQGEEFDAENAHEFFKLKFLRSTVVNTDTGELLGSTVRSTTTLNTSEFNEYLEKITAWMADYGIVVPEPSPIRQMEKRCLATTE